MANPQMTVKIAESGDRAQLTVKIADNQTPAQLTMRVAEAGDQSQMTVRIADGTHVPQMTVILLGYSPGGGPINGILLEDGSSFLLAESGNFLVQE